MGLRHAISAYFNVLIVASTLVVFCAGIPTSLVEEIKSSEIRNNKVKRAHSANLLNTETNDEDVPYYKPSAIKRGVNLDVKSLPEIQWEQDQDFISRNALPNVSSSLFRYPDSASFDEDKTLGEYEKGYRYGTNKDNLDEALENAVLKSELYGDTGAVNQYRLQPRYKREIDIDLTPEQILALLSLYENNQRQHQMPQSENYRYPWTRFETNSVDSDDSDGQEDGSWLDSPVYPHASGYEKEPGRNYLYETGPQDLEGKQDRWRGFKLENRNKRFMVSKRRTVDPTRELRYLNGPNRNDFYTLSQLLSNQRSSDQIPVYRRIVL